MCNKIIPLVVMFFAALPFYTSAASPMSVRCVDITSTLSIRSQNEEVKKLQSFLVAQALLPSTSVTGYFGEATEKAVQSFQCKTLSLCDGAPTKNGYGKVGPVTVAAIKNACSPTPAAAPVLAASVVASSSPDVFISEVYKMIFGKPIVASNLEKQRTVFSEGELTGNRYLWRMLQNKLVKEDPKSDAEFVTMAYALILKRAPDAAGKKNFIDQLASGIYREEVFRRILFSPESQKTNVALFATGYLVRSENVIEGTYSGAGFNASETTSFAPTDKILMTHFFYWYKTPGNTTNFTTYPSTYPTFTNPLLSYQNVAWYEKELRDMVRAGIDVMLPVYWGFPHADTATNVWSNAIFAPLEQAMQNLEAEGLVMPKVGMFYDTTTHEQNPVHKLDLKTTSDQVYFANTISDFFSQLPPKRWAQIGGKPIVMMYGSSFTKGYDQQVFTRASDIFAANFAGKKPFYITEVSWKNVVVDAKVGWGAAYTGPTVTETTVEIGPGYDESNIKTRPLARKRDRAGGDFYRQSWETAISKNKNIIVLETWNEYFEGTDISDSRDYGYLYIDLTRQYSTAWKTGKPVVVTSAATTTTATKPIPKDSAVFVEYLYNCVLGRNSEKKGYDNWFEKTSSSTFFKMYNGFFSSREYIGKKVSDEQFVKQLYSCVLFREPDSAGTSEWLRLLSAGKSRPSVIRSFVNSKEFSGPTGTTLSRNTGIGF